MVSYVRDQVKDIITLLLSVDCIVQIRPKSHWTKTAMRVLLFASRSVHVDAGYHVGMVRRFVAKLARLGANQLVAVQDFVFHAALVGV